MQVGKLLERWVRHQRVVKAMAKSVNLWNTSHMDQIHPRPPRKTGARESKKPRRQAKKKRNDHQRSPRQQKKKGRWQRT